MEELNLNSLGELELDSFEDLNISNTLELDVEDIENGSIIPNVSESLVTHKDVKTVIKNAKLKRDEILNFMTEDDVNKILTMYVADVNMLYQNNNILKEKLIYASEELDTANEYYNQISQRTDNVDKQLSEINENAKEMQSVIKQAQEQQRKDTETLKKLSDEKATLQEQVNTLTHEIEELKNHKLKLEETRDKLENSNAILEEMNKSLTEKGEEIETELLKYSKISKNHIELIRDMQDSAIDLQEIHDMNRDKYIPLIHRLDDDTLEALNDDAEILISMNQNFKYASYYYYLLSKDIREMLDQQVETAKEFDLEFESGTVLSNNAEKDENAMIIYEEGKMYAESLKEDTDEDDSFED